LYTSERSLFRFAAVFRAAARREQRGSAWDPGSSGVETATNVTQYCLTQEIRLGEVPPGNGRPTLTPLAAIHHSSITTARLQCLVFLARTSHPHAQSPLSYTRTAWTKRAFTQSELAQFWFYGKYTYYETKRWQYFGGRDVEFFPLFPIRRSL